ncbi:MAG: hypothetical protein ACYDHW_01090 [Syntrophorhabdaceae bacterium]
MIKGIYTLLFSAIMMTFIFVTYAYTADPGVKASVQSIPVQAGSRNPVQQSPQRTIPRTTIVPQAPSITISAPPAEAQRTTAISADLTIVTNKLATICWKLDNGAQTCSAPQVTRFKATLMNLTAGNHKLDVTATDADYRTRTTSRNWTVVIN